MRPVDPGHFRSVMGNFATGVTVVTATGPSGPVGMTANAIASLSLEPLLLLVAFDNTARTLQVVRDTGRFGVNVLAAGQVLVVVAAADGLILVAQGHDLPDLHLIYGLTPLGVSFLAEQLRLASADSVLQARGLEDAQAMRGLGDDAQQEIVTAIVLREMAIMAASALVVVVLGLRAGGWL
jgi:hypothetical protein